MAVINTNGMVTTVPRKIRNINGTFNISIPSSFLRSASLKSGDEIEFLFNDKVLVVFPKGKMPTK